MSKTSRLAGLLKEPLVHFLGGALLVFGLFWATGTDRDPADYNITIDASDIARLQAGWVQNFRRNPTKAELNGLIDQEVAEEIYYREALRLGLDKNDPVIRRRLSTKLQFLDAQELGGVAPSDAELQQWMDSSPEKYAASPLYSFEQIYLGQSIAKDKAAQILKNLNSGKTDPEHVHEPLSIDIKFSQFAADDISRLFGQKFTDQIAELSAGQWAGPVQSGYGQHLVKLSEKSPGKPSSLESVRETVLNDWRSAQKAAAKKENLDTYRDQYEIIIAGRK